jgi:hypothetical protein
MGFLNRLRRRGRRRKVDVDALAARASAAGIDGATVKEILESSRDANGQIDWPAAITKAQQRGLDMQKLRGLMR